MSQKNETPVLVLALLITAGLVGGGFWWFTRTGINLGGSGGFWSDNLITSDDDDPNSSPSQLPQQSGSNNFASVQ